MMDDGGKLSWLQKKTDPSTDVGNVLTNLYFLNLGNIDLSLASDSLYEENKEVFLKNVTLYELLKNVNSYISLSSNEYIDGFWLFPNRKWMPKYSTRYF